MNGGKLAHLFSVWSTPPGHAARGYRCQSEVRLSVICPDGGKKFCLSLESTFEPQIRGTPLAGRLDPKHRKELYFRGRLLHCYPIKETLVWVELVALQPDLWRPPFFENIPTHRFYVPGALVRINPAKQGGAREV